MELQLEDKSKNRQMWLLQAEKLFHHKEKLTSAEMQP